MSYKETTSEKLKVLINKEMSLHDLSRKIANIVELEKVQETFYNSLDKSQIGLYGVFLPGIYEKDIEYNEYFKKNIGTLEYYFGEDDNQIFIDYEVIKENEFDYKKKVKVIDIWY